MFIPLTLNCAAPSLLQPAIHQANLFPACASRPLHSQRHLPSPLPAPTSCLQYYQGVTGQIKTYNYDVSTGLQLSNQDYTSCVRTEMNFCGIQYMACQDTGKVMGRE